MQALCSDRPGGSALFDSLFADILDVRDVPPRGPPSRRAGRDETKLVGGYGPLTLDAGAGGTLVLDAAVFGEPAPLVLRRVNGDAFVVDGDPPRGMTIAVEDDLLYLGSFAVPRNG